MKNIAFRNVLRYWHNKRNYNRINWFRTIQINFMLLPFRTACKFPILIYGPCELGVLRGDVVFESNPYRGMLKIGLTDPLRNISLPSFISICGNFYIGKDIILRRGVRLRVECIATLQIQDNVSIGVCCSIQVTRGVFIGKATSIGNNTTIMDTDFHYLMNTIDNSIKNNVEPIVLGEQNWIGGNCTIKKGTKTPKGTILAGPYSMLGKDYTTIINEYCLIAGSPAKLLLENVRRVNNIDSEVILQNYFENVEFSNFILKKDPENFCCPNNVIR